MKILALETSGLVGSVALVSDRSLIAEYFLNLPITHSERLLPAIKKLLEDCRISLREIDGLAFSLGPGSFTALRIGASTVKGLALSLGRPVVGISTLDILAHNFSYTHLLICPLLDAKKNQVYSALYKGNGKGFLKRVTPFRVTEPQRIFADIYEETLFLGDGSIRYQGLINDFFGERAYFAPLDLTFPRASTLARIGIEKMEKGTFLDLDSFTPLYLRLSEAEEKRSLRSSNLIE